MNDIRTDPCRWPHRWVLPVVSIGTGGPDADLGLVTHQNGEVLPVVFRANLLDISGPAVLRRAPRITYPDLDALWAEWRVD